MDGRFHADVTFLFCSLQACFLHYTLGFKGKLWLVKGKLEIDSCVGENTKRVADTDVVSFEYASLISYFILFLFVDLFLIC